MRIAPEANAVFAKPSNGSSITSKKILVNASKLPHDFMPHPTRERPDRDDKPKDDFKEIAAEM